MPVGTPYIGSLSDPEKIALYNSTVEEGFQAAFDRPQELVYKDIAMVKTPADLGGLYPGTYPEKISFGFSPPNGRAEQLKGKRHARPLSTHSLEISPVVYTDTLYVNRQDFDRDVHGILRKVPRDLRRTEAKNPDVLLASLLQNGKVGYDYTGPTNSRFFATGKACSPEGSISSTYKNLYTASPLTEANLAAVVESMMGILASDGLILGVRPDTLIVPLTLWQEAVIATKMASIVWSTGNLAPGQQTATSAQADNPMALLLKWIRRIVVFPELADGQSINNTTWYVADCSNGPMGLVYALCQPAEFVAKMAADDDNVFFNDKLYWGYRKVEAAGYGLPQFIARCEA